MPRLDTVLVLLLAMPALSFANSDPVRNTVERRQDHRQLAVDRTWAERDAQELREFEAMAASLKDAMQDRMAGRYREVNTRLLEAMDREIQQSGVKADQAAHEAGLWREFRNERMEASTSGGGRDFLQAMDDRHDLRDDRRDRDNAVLRHDDMIRIGTMAGALRNDVERGDRMAMKRNITLAEDFLKVMRRDVASTRAERAEDRVELREDRRETRTDRR
ncbi:MAG TPA: hypothetical protein VFH33_02515 [Candidatus Krumholzibacteria bacterium]|nr:hypothetical protein [Candidatus Krumholzibacteria bacterium]